MNEIARSVLFAKYSSARRNEIALVYCEISWWIRFKECKQWSSRKYNECQVSCRNFKISFFFYLAKNTFVVFSLRASRKIIVDEKFNHSFLLLSWFLETYVRRLRRRCMIVTSFHILNCLIWCAFDASNVWRLIFDISVSRASTEKSVVTALNNVINAFS